MTVSRDGFEIANYTGGGPWMILDGDIYFGPRPLIENNSVKSKAMSLVNLEGRSSDSVSIGERQNLTFLLHDS